MLEWKQILINMCIYISSRVLSANYYKTEIFRIYVIYVIYSYTCNALFIAKSSQNGKEAQVKQLFVFDSGF